MGEWAVVDGQRLESVGAVTASSLLTGVTASASPNVKGSYSELIAVTAFEAHGIIITIQWNLATGGTFDALVDLAIGAGGSEQVICANLAHSTNNNHINQSHYYFPITIPAGSRLAARVQGSAGSIVVQVGAMLLTGGFGFEGPMGIMTTYGAATGDSGGVSVDAGGTINTKGAYAQIVAATTFPIRALIVHFGNQVNTTRATTYWLVDLAIGAAASEQVIIPNWPVTGNANVDILEAQNTLLIPVFIPAGTRLAARSQCAINDATDRLLDVIVYGVS